MAWIRRTFGAASILSMCLAMGAGTASATDLGRALQFAGLSSGNKVVVGPGAGVSSLKLGGHAVTVGNGAGTADIVTNPGGIILGPNAGADACVTDGAKVKVGKNAACTSIDTSGTNSDLATLSGAIVDASTYVTHASSQTATQPSPGAVKIGKNGSQTITDNVTGGLNVISVPSITIGNGGKLLVSGGANDTVLLLVGGNVKLTPDAVLTTTGGLPETSLLILASGKSVTIAHDAVLNATVLAPNANCVMGPNSGTRGAYLCGKHISVNHDAGLEGEATSVTVP